MSRPSKVLVVGGGAVGLATALSLATEGLEVSVVEAGKIGMQTSYGNGGWLSPALTTPAPAAPGMPSMALRETFQRDKAVLLKPRLSADFLSWSLHLLRNCRREAYERNCRYLSTLSGPMWDTFDELRAQGAQFEMHATGNLRACQTQQSAARQLEELAPMRRAGFNVPTRTLDKREVHELEPALSERVVSGFLLPDERHVNPMSFVSGLADFLRARSVEVREDLRVQGVDVRGDRARGVLTDAGSIQADVVILAAGIWTRELVRPMGVTIPLRAGKGYSFFVELPVAPRRPIYMSDSKVGLSPIGGRVRIAGGMEISRDDLSLNARLVRGMVSTASSYLADWPANYGPTAVSTAWVGMRPLTTDGLPIIDRIGALNNLFVSTGHGMTGIGLSLVSGRHLASFVKTSKRPEVLEPFRLDRFGR